MSEKRLDECMEKLEEEILKDEDMLNQIIVSERNVKKGKIKELKY